MANFGLRGLPGWPLPPPPLIEGVDRRTHRQAKTWNDEHHHGLDTLPQRHERYLSPQRHEAFSPELTTVLRTSPLRKWSQDVARRQTEAGHKLAAPTTERQDSLEEDSSLSGDGSEAVGGDHLFHNHTLSPQSGDVGRTHLNDNRQEGDLVEPIPCPAPAEACPRLSPLQEDSNSVDDDEDSPSSGPHQDPVRRKPSPQRITLSRVEEEEVLEVEVEVQEEEEEKEDLTRFDYYDELEYDEEEEEGTSECITAGKSDSYFEDDVFIPIDCIVVDDVDVEGKSSPSSSLFPLTTHACLPSTTPTLISLRLVYHSASSLSYFPTQISSPSSRPSPRPYPSPRPSPFLSFPLFSSYLSVTNLPQTSCSLMQC